MRTHIIASTTVLAAFSLAVVPLAAQNGSGPSPAAAKAPETPAGPGPRTVDGKPSLSGVWEVPYVPDMSRGIGTLPFTEWGEQNWKGYDPAKFDYTAHCLPMGWTRQMNAPMPLEIMQEPNRIAILFEAWNTFKVIPTDGRSHPKNVDPTWMGNSVGHWEGDTLVIDTIGFNDKTRLDTIGHPHSDQMHVVERLTRTDAMHIAYEVTVEDPKTYTKTFTNKRTFNLKPAWELMEYACEENNKDVGEGHIK
jgi:hypothetical protein